MKRREIVVMSLHRIKYDGILNASWYCWCFSCKLSVLGIRGTDIRGVTSRDMGSKGIFDPHIQYLQDAFVPLVQSHTGFSIDTEPTSVSMRKLPQI